MTTRTEEYINSAVERAKKELSGTNVTGCHIEMHMEADGATQLVAEALVQQAKANIANSEAIKQLALSLKPIEVCGVKIQGGALQSPQWEP